VAKLKAVSTHPSQKELSSGVRKRGTVETQPHVATRRRRCGRAESGKEVQGGGPAVASGANVASVGPRTSEGRGHRRSRPSNTSGRTPGDGNHQAAWVHLGKLLLRDELDWASWKTLLPPALNELGRIGSKIGKTDIEAEATFTAMLEELRVEVKKIIHWHYDVSCGVNSDGSLSAQDRSQLEHDAGVLIEKVYRRTVALEGKRLEETQREVKKAWTRAERRGVLRESRGALLLKAKSQTLMEQLDGLVHALDRDPAPEPTQQQDRRPHGRHGRYQPGDR